MEGLHLRDRHPDTAVPGAIRDESVPVSLRRHPRLLSALLRKRGEPPLSPEDTRRLATVRRRGLPAPTPRTRAGRMLPEQPPSPNPATDTLHALPGSPEDDRR